MSTQLPKEHLQHPASVKAFRTIKFIATGYVCINILALAAIFLLRNKTALVTSTVWTRGTILACTSLLLLFFVNQLTRGSRQGWVRVRIISLLLFVSVLILLVIPGILPLWMKLEQAICGLLLLGLIIVTNSRHIRSIFG